MIEVVLDGNNDNKFCSKEYPVIEINYLEDDSWDAYRKIAEKIIADNSHEYALIIKNDNNLNYRNKVSLKNSSTLMPDTNTCFI